MTAFGRSTLNTSSGEILCELRSVNHRYLDISIRLAEPLRAAEQGIRERLTGSLHRGKVEVAMKFSDAGPAGESLVINDALLLQLTEAAGKVAALTRATCIIDSVRLLQWPGVVLSRSDVADMLIEEVHHAFELAMQDFVETRQREGAQLMALLLNRNEQLAALVLQLRARREEVVIRQREKLFAKLAGLAVDHDEARLEQELVYAAQRLDIDEELDRLDAHVIEVGLVLQRDEPVGRRLDFLMQEFNREANTISSKSADKDTTALAVDMKVLIEQMREQVQNVE